VAGERGQNHVQGIGQEMGREETSCKAQESWKGMFYDIGTLLIYCPHCIFNSITLNASGISKKY